MGDEELTLVLKLRDEATAQMKKAQAGIGGSVKKIAKVAAAAALAIGAAVGTAGFKLFKLGAAAEESSNVVGLAFGSMKQQVIDWSNAYSQATGSSKFESRGLAGDLGLVIKGMGFTEQATFDMSTRMVELAGDMGSAKDVPLAEALDKIRAGLIGESEPLRTMGVLLSEARVKEEAYATGLAVTGAALTNTQKVQARMNIILADSIAMHGDLENTQHSQSNTWKNLGNTIHDNAIMLAHFFKPQFRAVLDLMVQGVDTVIALSKSLYQNRNESNRWTEALGNVWMILKAVWSMVKPLVVILKDGLGWVIQKLIIPVIKGMVDNFNTLISNLQTGYNWLARLVPGMEEVAVSTAAASVSVDTLSTELDIAEPAAVEFASALAGGPVGQSVAPSLKEAAEKMEDFALTTDTQWAAYQRLWPVADKNADILVSRMIPALSTLSTTGTAVGHGQSGRGSGGISEALATTGSASTTFLDTMATAISPDNITSIFTAAFTGAGGCARCAQGYRVTTGRRAVEAFPDAALDHDIQWGQGHLHGWCGCGCGCGGWCRRGRWWCRGCRLRIRVLRYYCGDSGVGVGRCWRFGGGRVPGQVWATSVGWSQVGLLWHREALWGGEPTDSHSS